MLKETNAKIKNGAVIDMCATGAHGASLRDRKNLSSVTLKMDGGRTMSFKAIRHMDGEHDRLGETEILFEDSGREVFCGTLTELENRLYNVRYQYEGEIYSREEFEDVIRELLDSGDLFYNDTPLLDVGDVIGVVERERKCYLQHYVGGLGECAYPANLFVKVVTLDRKTR